MSAWDEERLAELLRALPPAPEAWVQGAQELPFVRLELDEIMARAEEDAGFRKSLIADPEVGLEKEGYEPSPALVEELRRRLANEADVVAHGRPSPAEDSPDEAPPEDADDLGQDD